MSIRLRNTCPACSREEIRKKQSDEIAKNSNRSTELPALISGSAWQIAWAEDIRVQSMERLQSFCSRFPSDTRQTIQRTATKLMSQQIKAGWWIENQNNIFGALAIHCAEPLEAAILDIIRIQMHAAARFAVNVHGVR